MGAIKCHRFQVFLLADIIARDASLKILQKNLIRYEENWLQPFITNYTVLVRIDLHSNIRFAVAVNFKRHRSRCVDDNFVLLNSVEIYPIPSSNARKI